MKIIYITFVSLLVGCSSASAPIATVVNVPVAVPCKIVVPDRPALAVDSLQIGANIWDKMVALRADRLAQKAYEQELEAAANSCK